MPKVAPPEYIEPPLVERSRLVRLMRLGFNLRQAEDLCVLVDIEHDARYLLEKKGCPVTVAYRILRW